MEARRRLVRPLDKIRCRHQMNPAAKTGNRLWAGMFLLVLVLSQDAWLFWDPDVLLGPWNLALRVFYFLGLQFLLAVPQSRETTAARSAGCSIMYLSVYRPCYLAVYRLIMSGRETMPCR